MTELTNRDLDSAGAADADAGRRRGAGARTDDRRALPREPAFLFNELRPGVTLMRRPRAGRALSRRHPPRRRLEMTGRRITNVVDKPMIVIDGVPLPACWTSG